MEAHLQRMEVELRLLRKKYFHLQQTIEEKVDGHAKTILAELEDEFVEKALQKVLEKLGTTISSAVILKPGSLVSVDPERVDDGISQIQLQSAGQINGEMIAANIKTEPIDYDEVNSVEPEVLHFGYDPTHFDSMQTECDLGETEHNTIVIENCVGSHGLLGEIEEDADDLPILDQMGYSSDFNELEDQAEPIAERTPTLRDRTPTKPPVLKSVYEDTDIKPTERSKEKLREKTKEKTAIKSAAKSKKHRCAECGMQFSNESFLRRHMVKHLKSRPFNCALCPRSYKNMAHLRRHLKTNHSTSDKTNKEVKKKEKNVKSPSKPKAEDSLEVIGSRNNYDCSICGKHFSYPSHLKPHLLSHARKLAKKGSS